MDQESLINNYRLQFQDIMNFIDGMNFQNYQTIDKTREITDKLIKSNKRLEENYDSNEYELGIFKKSKIWLQYVNKFYVYTK